MDILLSVSNINHPKGQFYLAVPVGELKKKRHPRVDSRKLAGVYSIEHADQTRLARRRPVTNDLIANQEYRHGRRR